MSQKIHVVSLFIKYVKAKSFNIYAIPFTVSPQALYLWKFGYKQNSYKKAPDFFLCGMLDEFLCV